MTLFEHLKHYAQGRESAKPEGLLYRTLENGVLWLLGGWLYDELLEECRVGELDGEYRLWHVSDTLDLLEFAGPCEPDSVQKARTITEALCSLYDTDDGPYYEALNDEGRVADLLDSYQEMLDANAARLRDLRVEYAADYADRVFHDRQLCAFISQLMLAIGYNGALFGSEDEPRQWVERRKWPTWVKPVLEARERGHCPMCRSGLTLELERDAQIDHIVPLSRGGTNDLVNLQMLCAECNRAKSNQDVSVSSSIPRYLARRLVK